MAWTSVASAQPADVATGVGAAAESPTVALGYGAMPGGIKAPSAETLPAGMFGVGLIGGYGVRNKLLGADHKMSRGIGDVAFAYAPTEMLTLGLAFDGRFDQHEGLSPDGDDGYVGDPRLIARLGKRLGNGKMTVGGQLAILVPGKDAPSVAASAISVEARGLFSVAAGPGTLSLNAGVRIDNSAKSVVDDDGNDNRMLLSAEDRVSLGVSDYHALVAGVHYLLPIGPKAYVGFEGSLDLFFGAHVPDGITEPEKPGQTFRFGAQGGIHLTRQWTAFAFLQGAVVPSIDAADVTAGTIALIPYEPTFTGGLAIAARFGGGGKTGGGSVVANDCERDPEKCKPVTVTVIAEVSGSVVDDTGNPVAGAKVTVRLKNNTGTATTDEKGEWKVANVPIGKTVNNKTELDDTGAEVTVEVEGKKPKTTTLTLKEGNDNKVPPITLDPVLPPGQFKAVVRTAGKGTPIAGITVKLEPGGASAVTDADGNISLDVQPGTYKATASGLGFKDQTLDVVIEQSAVVVKQFELSK